MNPVHLMTRQELALSFDVMVRRATRAKQLLFNFAPAFNAAWLARNAQLNGSV